MPGFRNSCALKHVDAVHPSRFEATFCRMFTKITSCFVHLRRQIFYFRCRASYTSSARYFISDFALRWTTPDIYSDFFFVTGRVPIILKNDNVDFENMIVFLFEICGKRSYFNVLWKNTPPLGAAAPGGRHRRWRQWGIVFKICWKQTPAFQHILKKTANPCL